MLVAGLIVGRQHLSERLSIGKRPLMTGAGAAWGAITLVGAPQQSPGGARFVARRWRVPSQRES